MNAVEFGRRLLGEVEEITLQELLSSLHSLAATTTTSSTSFAPRPPHPYPYLNIPIIDSLLSLSHPPTSLPYNALHNPHQQFPPIIELTSPTPGTFKTHFLYHLIAAAVLPPSNGGKGCAAVVLDTDAGFDVVRLAGIFRGLIVQHSETTTPGTTTTTPTIIDDAANNEASNSAAATAATAKAAKTLQQDVEEIIHTSLQHIHIFRPTSLASLIATIQTLPAYLFDSSAHHSFERQVSLLVVDSVTAFFWQQRMGREGRGVGSREDEGDEDDTSPTRPEDKTTPTNATLTAALLTSQSLFGHTVIVTRSGHLHSPLITAAHTNSTLQLTITRDAVNKFPVEMAVEEAERDRGVRQDVVEKGRGGLWVKGVKVGSVSVGVGVGEGVVVGAVL